MEETHNALQEEERPQYKEQGCTTNLLPSLPGIAWREVESLGNKATESDDGFAMILAALDKTFKHDDQVEMPRACETFVQDLALRRPDLHQLHVAGHCSPTRWRKPAAPLRPVLRAEAGDPRQSGTHPSSTDGSTVFPLQPIGRTRLRTGSKMRRTNMRMTSTTMRPDGRT